MIDDDDLVGALRRQWQRIATHSKRLDFEAPSRIGGWRNAEVMAHLAVQPVLLSRFLTNAEPAQATMQLEDNLAGTRLLAGSIDAHARRGAHAGQVDFAGQVTAVDSVLNGADIRSNIATLQGPIALADYLRTRCVEAVVHGMDLRPPVAPDPAALAVTADALMTLLRRRAPHLTAAASDCPAEIFVDVATGRVAAPPALAEAMPLMM
jgi:hypothetical protein